MPNFGYTTPVVSWGSTPGTPWILAVESLVLLRLCGQQSLQEVHSDSQVQVAAVNPCLLLAVCLPVCLCRGLSSFRREGCMAGMQRLAMARQRGCGLGGPLGSSRVSRAVPSLG